MLRGADVHSEDVSDSCTCCWAEAVTAAGSDPVGSEGAGVRRPSLRSLASAHPLVIPLAPCPPFHCLSMHRPRPQRKSLWGVTEGRCRVVVQQNKAGLSGLHLFVPPSEGWDETDGISPLSPQSRDDKDEVLG